MKLPLLTTTLVLSLSLVLLFSSPSNAHNITRLLAKHPEFSTFNHYLSATHLAAEINRRETITVLALDNAAMSSLLEKHLSIYTLKNVLSLHVLVDYFGAKKLHQITNGTTLASSMFQATGAAAGTSGYVNITNLKGGKVGFGAAGDDGAVGLRSFYVKSVMEMPYNISVLQISQGLTSADAEAPTAGPSLVNLTSIMAKQGCKAFADLLRASKPALATFEENVDGGLTVFCPTDAAVGGFMPKYKNLTEADKVALLLYHGIPVYESLQMLKSNNGIVNTLATEGANKYDFTIQDDGEIVKLETKVVTATIVGTLIDQDPFVVYKINKFGRSKSGVVKMVSAGSVQLYGHISSTNDRHIKWYVTINMNEHKGTQTMKIMNRAKQYMKLHIREMDFRRRTARHIRPGPEDPSLLYLQDRHISEAVWQQHPDRVLRPRRHRAVELLNLPVQIVPLLEHTGFYAVARVGYIPYDHALISALVERWRPETHSFHMPMGECIITLQDVAIQLRLPIDGWLRFSEVPENAIDVQLEQFTRGDIMRLLGCFLMPDMSGNLRSLTYLPLLENLDDVKKYSWGSAVLAYLYRLLCRATEYKETNIGGCMHLLHVWAWDRFPLLTPRQKRPHPRRLSEEDESQDYPIRPPLSFGFVERLKGVVPHVDASAAFVQEDNRRHVLPQCCLGTIRCSSTPAVANTGLLS
ncbi:fasciclin-like arabinogalactan protein 2 [Senna tora]|uniref:Fasciclin-like arabinogalactan protein 2 n=1 Tax=Senna tora TaxID=362788 RepID=A0A834WVQ7_9FABA|nr:fasciclin-like arabinogalactan protein 2 [Senna tora]